MTSPTKFVTNKQTMSMVKKKFAMTKWEGVLQLRALAAHSASKRARSGKDFCVPTPVVERPA